MEPCTLSDLLNGYLAGMTSVVFSHEGTVAKIVGDALHILFGAPGDQPDHAARAVACALDLDDFAQSFRETWRQKRTAPGPTRIGVNAGSAIIGNFGGGRFFDYTAYRDTINIAARLEAAYKQLGTRICVSESVVRQVLDFRGRPVGDLVLRGRSEPLRAFEGDRLASFHLKRLLNGATGTRMEMD
jgi:adenylate cyclase